MLVANPFGRKAFTKGETFRLRFAVLAYASEVDAKAAATALSAD